jgi:multiple sugar transport system substrate-binding protein
MNGKLMSRRALLRTIGLSGVGLAAAAVGCQPQTVTVKETVVVEKAVKETVVVENVVKETVVVEKQVTSAAPAAPEAINLRFLGRLGNQGDHFSLFAQRFNEKNYPDIFVKVELFANADYFQKLDTMIAGQTMGDGFWIYVGGGFDQYVASNVYAPLDDVVAATGYDLGQYYPDSIETLTIGGKLYGMPWTLHLGSACATYYSKPIFDAAGVPYPEESWEWTDLIETAKKLTNPDEGIFGLRCENYYAGNPVTLARAYGGDLLSADGTKCTLADETTRQGLQIFSDFYMEYQVSPASAQLVGTWQQMFAGGKLAMAQTGFWGKGLGSYVAPDTWSTVASPYGPAGHGNTQFVDTVGVTAISKYPAETFAFLTELCSYDAGMDIWQKRGSVPGSRPDVWNSEAALADAHFKVFSDMLKKDGMPPKLPLPANFREKEYWSEIDKGLEPIYLGEKALDELIDNALTNCQAVLDQSSLF